MSEKINSSISVVCTMVITKRFRVFDSHTWHALWSCRLFRPPI